ncbi:ArsR/SmtB family transcription factor [Agrococcus sediminis]|uniref:ArsR/SmtB family transcription factor n=1 Tax=Agrococcus TaxID=46352 RepID=UPI0028565093|nr:metalloregulator ArsR/SmtB family transcription factor [Agrococcus sp. BE272]MDR7233455.1 DNA-binding transcriptional ArsR family regulator [Agrococcus sp. BE272]
MTMILERGDADVGMTTAFAHLFQALAEPSRLRVLQHLSTGEHRVRDLVGHLGLAQSTVSKHMAFLTDCGLVNARADGRATWYALAHPEDLERLAAAAERLLEAAGAQQRPCSHISAHAAVVAGATGEEDPDGRRA